MTDRIEDLFDEFLEAALTARTVDLEAFLAAHPELADEERRRLHMLVSALQPSRAPSAPSANAATSELPQVFGPYRLLRVLGHGGQGVVYLAQDTRLARNVALKVLDRPDLAGFADALPSGPVARLKREAEVASKLDHPGLSVVYEMGSVGRSPYVAMRYVEGETLARKIATAREAGLKGLPSDESSSTSLRLDSGSGFVGDGSRRTLTRCVRLIESAARALHVAHRSGVVHRDIKPANIMITPEDEPVLLDFGLARDHSNPSESLTQSGEVFGSPAYMSPEQISPGRPTLDARTDVYALGVCLYECLTLRRPFEHPTREELFRSILSEDPPDPRRSNPAVDRDLAIVLETALEKDRDRRYPSAAELAEDLRRWRRYEPIRARPASALLHLKRWTQRHRALAASLFGLFAVLLGLLVAARLEIDRRKADANRSSGDQLVIASTKVLSEDPALALLLAIAGADHSPGLAANNALYAALQRIRESRTIEARSPAVTGLAVTPDGKYVITAWKDGLVRVRDADHWSTVATLQGPSVEVSSLDLSADGRWLAATSVPDECGFAWSSTCWNGKSEFDVSAADVVFHLPNETAANIRISADGGRALTWGRLGFCATTIQGGDRRAFEFQPPSALSGAWDRRGERALLIGPDRIWNVLTGETLPLEGKVNAGTTGSSGEFSEEDRTLVTASEQGGASIWDASNGSLVTHLDCPGRTTVARFSPGRATIFVGCSDGRGDLFEAATGRMLAAFRGHKQPISQAAFLENGTRIETISEDGSARIWDARTGNEVAEFLCDSPIATCSTLADGSQFVTGQVDGSLRLWDRDDEWTRAIVDDSLPSDTYPSCCFDPAGARIAATAGREVRIYDARTHARLGTLTGHEKRVHGVVFCPDGRTLLTASEDDTVRTWDAATFAPTGVIGREDHGRPVWSVDVSFDGRLALTACEDGRVRLYDLSSRQLAREFRHDGGVRCAHFSRDGRRIVSTSEQDRTIRVWDVGSDVPDFTIRFTNEQNRPMTCRFSPDGRRLVAGTAGASFRIFDASNGHSIRTIMGQPQIVNDASYSPDGSQILSGSGTGLHLWSAESGEEIAVVPDRDVTSAAFSPDGGRILSIDGDLKLRIWPAGPLAAARARVPRDFTDAERANYRLPSPAER